MNTGRGRTARCLVFSWFLLVAVGLVACGSGGGTVIESSSEQQLTSTTGPQATDVGEASPRSTATSNSAAALGEGAWILDQLPDGFAPAVVQDGADSRAVIYQRQSGSGDVFDGQLSIITSNQGPGPAGIPGAEEVTLHGRTGYLLPLADDGVTYGLMVLWPDDQQRWIMLQWGESVADDDVLAVAAGARAVDADEWAALNRTLGSAATVLGEVPDAVEEIVAEGSSSAGTSYQLVALVPPDYPLSENDRRLTCFRLDVGGQPGERRCNRHGWWTRIDGTTIVHGPVDTEASGVVLAEMSIDGSPVDPTPIAVDVVRTTSTAPIAFFLAEVPGWCWIDVTVTDGTNALYSMPGGPLPANEHHAECLAGVSTPSTTADP